MYLLTTHQLFSKKTAVIDISGEPDILEKVPGDGAAFVPIKEFLEALRQVETER